MPRRSLAIIALACVVSFTGAPLAAQDSTGSRPHGAKTFLQGRDLAVLGGAFVASAALTPFDVRIARWWQSPEMQSHTGWGRFADNVSRIQETTLTLTGVGLYGISKLAHMESAADVTFHMTASIVTASILSQAIRGPLGRSRPDETHFSDQYDFHAFQGFTNFNYRAYPSLHAASNFAAATALVEETHRRHPKATWAVATVTYGVASLSPTARMYLGRHWASDILMGAAVGVWAGHKVVDYSHEHRVTPVDRFFLGVQPERRVGVLPAGGGMMLGYQYQF